MAKQIVDVLAQLDPNNNEHWTSDGLPRLDAVKTLASNPSITREDVNKAKPGFLRPVQPAVTAAPWGDQQGQGIIAPWGQPSASDAATKPNNDGIDEDGIMVEKDFEAPAIAKVENLSSDPNVAEIQGRLEAATTILKALQSDKVEIDNQLKLAQQEVDAIADELQELVGIETTSDAIQGYLSRQREILNERAGRMKAIQNSGVDLRALTAGLKAPIDVAMTRKTGRGGKRPSRV